MVFSSVIFLMVFLPIVLLTASLIYLSLYSLKSNKFVILNLFLLLSSLLFYWWGKPDHTYIMLSVTFVTYISGILINRLKYKKTVLIIGIIFNIIIFLWI